MFDHFSFLSWEPTKQLAPPSVCRKQNKSKRLSRRYLHLPARSVVIIYCTTRGSTTTSRLWARRNFQEHVELSMCVHVPTSLTSREVGQSCGSLWKENVACLCHSHVPSSLPVCLSTIYSLSTKAENSPPASTVVYLVYRRCISPSAAFVCHACRGIQKRIPSRLMPGWVRRQSIDIHTR